MYSKAPDSADTLRDCECFGRNTILEPFTPLHSYTRCPGDFYNEHDVAVRRSCSPGRINSFGEPGESLWCAKDAPRRCETDMCQPAATEGGDRGCAPAGISMIPPAFSDSYQPAELPAFGKSSTSVGLGGMSPAAAACSVHQWLSSGARSSILKASAEKFSIKAVVFHESGGCLLHCTLKVRIFQNRPSPGDTHRFVAEFLRYEGDVVAFNHIAGLIASHLGTCEARAPNPVGDTLPSALERTGSRRPPPTDTLSKDACRRVRPESTAALRRRGGETAAPSRAFGLSSPPADACDAGRADAGTPDVQTPAAADESSPFPAAQVQPLIDMLSDGASQRAQLEAVTAFLAAASANAAAAALVGAALAEHRSLLRGLLAGTPFEVSYPAACLARRIGLPVHS